MSAGPRRNGRQQALDRCTKDVPPVRNTFSISRGVILAASSTRSTVAAMRARSSDPVLEDPVPGYGRADIDRTVGKAELDGSVR